MKGFEILPENVRLDPNNPNWTIPKTYGVWGLSNNSTGKRYRFGNYPVRAKELAREYGKVELVALYTSRNQARECAQNLNE